MVRQYKKKVMGDIRHQINPPPRNCATGHMGWGTLPMDEDSLQSP